MAKKWMQKAFEGAHGQLRAHYGVKEGEDIPVAKMNADLARLNKKDKLTPAEVRLKRRITLAMTARRAA